MLAGRPLALAMRELATLDDRRMIAIVEERRCGSPARNRESDLAGVFGNRRGRPAASWVVEADGRGPETLHPLNVVRYPARDHAGYFAGSSASCGA